MRKREYRDYLEDIIDSIEDIESFTKNMTLDEFANDRKTVNAVIRSLEVIGEAAKKIPKSIRDSYPSVSWRKMAGMRDKMIHEYFGIDVNILWKTIKEDVPPLKPLVREVLNSFGE